MDRKRSVALIGIVALISTSTPLLLQAYHETSRYTPGGQCTTLSRTLTIGDRDTNTGGEVSQLQRFIVGRNYPGGGSWMITGYFGAATAQGVHNFQSEAGLAVTGRVDGATRSAIQQHTCPSYGGGYTPTPPYPDDDYSSDVISVRALTPSAGSVGDTVVIHGRGFTDEGNTVRFGNGIVTNRRSYDGRTLSFTVPSELVGYGNESVLRGTYYVSVRNENGYTSNRLPFTVTSVIDDNVPPRFTSISGPNTLRVDESGTWTLGVRAPENSRVTVTATWGDERTGTFSSRSRERTMRDTHQTFTFMHAYQRNGSYTPTFTVSTDAGANTTSTQVDVTGSSSDRVSLDSLSSTSGARGSRITISGSGFTSSDNTVHFGVGGERNISSTNNGTRIRFTIPHHINPCQVIAGPCGAPVTEVETGQTYPIYITNERGATETRYFTVVN